MDLLDHLDKTEHLVYLALPVLLVLLVDLDQ